MFSAGKRIIITGASSGIGFAAALSLARHAGELILICRDQIRADAARETIHRQHPNTPVHILIADLSSPVSIAELVKHIHTRWQSVDILINNAGGIFFQRFESEDGLEYTFSLNHMGYFRLTIKLLPLLAAAGTARIINVSSVLHRLAPLDFSDLQHSTPPYRGFLAYGRSKLANILFTRELAKRTDSRIIQTVSLHPGFIQSNFASNPAGSWSGHMFHALSLVFGSSAEVGSAAIAFLANSPHIKHGGYYSNNSLSIPSRHARDEAAAQRLWDISMELA